jgi:hypothetical protein
MKSKSCIKMFHIAFAADAAEATPVIAVKKKKS